MAMKNQKSSNLFKIGFISTMVVSSFLFIKCSSDSADSQTAAIDEITAFSPEEEKALRDKANIFFASISDLPENDISEDKIALGKKLYYDTRLSLDGNISCNSCHDLKNYGVDNVSLSPGDTEELGDRNSPTVLYASLHNMQFWDGRAKDVEEQAGGPILNPVEHNIPSEEFLEERLRSVEEYVDLFGKVYADSAQPLTFATITDAIGAFERQLNPMSRFDEWLDGDDSAMTTEEKKGLTAFIDNNCITCHSGVAFGGTMLQKFGVYGDYWEHTKCEDIDEGRYHETGNEADKYFFKVPGLRNIEKTYPYFHNGSVESLEEAVRIMAVLQSGIDISEEDVQSITTFLKALTADVEDHYKEP